MFDAFPKTIRYVKNGREGQWWHAAKARGQIHAGWSNIPHKLLQVADFAEIKTLNQKHFDSKQGATQDFNALHSLLDHPSQHIWITFEDGYLWWCTVRDGIEINPGGRTENEGHFWLTCDRQWSNQSIGGRLLAREDLPGVITATAGFRATVCKPHGCEEILRIIRDEEDSDAIAAAEARKAYERAVARLVARLRERDFELLIDLILSRTGWTRLGKVGGATEGIDIEAENISINEIAFVQVKSTAGRAVLDDYISRFEKQQQRYQRMIFAVHTPKSALDVPPTGVRHCF